MEESNLIDRILEIELHWFLTVNPQLTQECQQHPEAFKVIRRSVFETWSPRTLELYWQHLVGAHSKERDLMREKYAKMDNLTPCLNVSPAIYEIVNIEERWLKEAVEKYPQVFKREVGEGFTQYLRCELDTYSQAVLEAYLDDLKMALAEGMNLVMERHDRIAQKIGFSSLEEWSRQTEVPG